MMVLNKENLLYFRFRKLVTFLLNIQIIETILFFNETPCVVLNIIKYDLSSFSKVLLIKVHFCKNLVIHLDLNS